MQKPRFRPTLRTGHVGWHSGQGPPALQSTHQTRLAGAKSGVGEAGGAGSQPPGLQARCTPCEGSVCLLGPPRTRPGPARASCWRAVEAPSPARRASSQTWKTSINQCWSQAQRLSAAAPSQAGAAASTRSATGPSTAALQPSAAVQGQWLWATGRRRHWWLQCACCWAAAVRRRKLRPRSTGSSGQPPGRSHRPESLGARSPQARRRVGHLRTTGLALC